MNVYLIPHSLSQRTEWHSGSHNDGDWVSRYWAVDYSLGVAEGNPTEYINGKRGAYVNVGGEIRATKDDSPNGVIKTLVELGFPKEAIAEACDLHAADLFNAALKKQREVERAQEELKRAQERLKKAKGNHDFS